MIQVAFAGHNRPHDLGLPGPVVESLDAAVGLLRSAGVQRARLLTGLAQGADVLAAEAWRRAGMGPIHAVYPFLTDAPAKGAEHLADTSTWLDGAAAETHDRNPYLKQTRLIVETADLVVVVWTGAPARGAGGTADAVLCALQLGIPVLWIRPAEPGVLRLIRPDRLPSDFHFPEFQEGLLRGGFRHVEPATPTAVRDLLMLDEPAPSPRAALTGWRKGLDAFLHRWLWRTHRTFRNLFGGKAAPSEPPPPLPADLQHQAGFATLSTVYAEADEEANAVSAVHRSEQVLLAMAMIVAAIFGSLYALLPAAKLPGVFVELSLGIVGLLVWAAASEGRQHERWGELRHLAEHLRLERAGWAVGVSLGSIGLAQNQRKEPPAGREVRRAAGLPEGRFNDERVRAWGAWAIGELIDSQIGYHNGLSLREGRTAHKIHLLEDASFLFLFIVLMAYVFMHLDGGHPPQWMSGVVVMTSVVVPAFAAAAIALEAKLEFNEQSSRSQRLASELRMLKTHLGPAPSFDTLQDVARASMRIHIQEAGRWREGAGRRALFRL